MAADLERMERALRNADAAGDVAAAQQIAQAIRAARGAADPRGTQSDSADPTADMGAGSRLLAGVGRGMTSFGRGVAGALGDSSLAQLNRLATGALGLDALRVPTRAQAQQASADAKATDAPLLNTTAGKVGNVLGMAALAAPTAFIPGAGTYGGAAAIGAGTGALSTEGGALERLQGGALGAAGGMAGKGVGDALGAGARRIAELARLRAAGAAQAAGPRMAAAQAGAEAGYVVPPADLRPGMMTEALSGLSGKIKTAQVASQRNQEVTNQLARRALGLADDAPLTPEALRGVRSQAGQAYDAVRGAGPLMADQQFGKALDDIGAAHRNVMPEFPGLARSDVPGFLQGLKRREGFDASTAVDAIRLLRSKADQAFRTGDSEMGRAAKAAAGELEALLERNLQAGAGAQQAIASARGAPAPTGPNPAEMLQNFRDARQLMAKSYTVEKALNPATGDVAAPVLARELAKGKPLSGDLRTIAELAQAFPKAMQSLKEAPKATSPLDWAIGGVGVGAGSPIPALIAAARPATRSLLLSPAFQRAALANSAAPGRLSQLPAGLLDQELARALYPGLLGAGLPAAVLTSE